jgi:RND family efflux transporter MFP subunit
MQEPSAGRDDRDDRGRDDAGDPGSARGPEAPNSSPAPGTGRVPTTAVVVVLLVVAALLGFGVYRHWRENAAAARTQQQTADFVPTLRAVTARREEDPIRVVLPGQTEPFLVANIYARATGYVAERRVDIGSRVRKGDLLLRIAAPDLDQQLAQAEAQLGQVRAAVVQAQAQVTQAQATLALQTTNLQRANQLTQQGYETAQNQQTQQTTVQSQQAALVTAQAGVKVAEANLQAQQATVDRLRALGAFENVVAPFDGVVTARNVEVGDLVNADAATGAPMFTLDRDDVLRVAVQVPQYSAQGIRDGLEAEVVAPQTPGRTFHGKVARSSVALLYSSRTLATEVDVPNPDGALRPGDFVDVTFSIPRTEVAVSLPSDALVFDQDGMQVAVVDRDGRVAMRKIDIYRDLGTTVELKDGLQGGETVLLGPPVDLRNGARVKVAPADADGERQAQN